MKVRLALAGIGNCASVFVQGLQFYSGGEAVGLWHPVVGGLKPGDIELVAAFDIDARKVGSELSEAVFAKPNVAKRYVEVPKTDLKVDAGISKADVAPHLARSKITSSGRSAVSRNLREAQADVLVKYLLDKYEKNLKDAPAGQTFEALYDQKTLEPTAEYQKMYEEVKAELRGLGLQFRS